MIITHHGGACIKLTAGDTSLVLGPVSKKSKNFKPINFGADVAFIPVQHDDMNGGEEASRGETKAFVIFGAGEYEISGVTAIGYPAVSHYGGKEKINTIYSIKMDGLNVMYLGAMDDELPKEVLELDSPDVLIVPISGDGTLSPAAAHKIAVQTEAKIIIPIMTSDKTLKQFLKEAGEEGVKAEDKLTIKPKDLAEKDNDVVVLSE